MIKSKSLAMAILLSMSTLTALPSFANSDGVVATVNNEIILQSELKEAMDSLSEQYQKQGQAIDATTLKNQALDMLILRKLQLDIINRAGFNINESVVNAQMLKIAQSQGFDNLTDFQKSLDAKKSGSYALLRRQFLEESALDILWQNQLSQRVKVDKQDIDAFLNSPEGRALNQAEYRSLHVRVPYPQNATVAQKAQATQVAERLRSTLTQSSSLQEAMSKAQDDYPVQIQGTDTGYHTTSGLPIETRDIITKLSVGEVSPIITADTGVDVIRLIDKRGSEQKITVPEWHTSHILIKADNSNAAIAEQKINEIYTALQRGANFEDLAATYSEDTGSATQKGSLGWVGEDQTVPAFEATMKNTEKGDFSTPFTTQFGYHILKVNDIRQRDVTNEYREAQAQEILINRLAPQAHEDWLQELKAGAYIDIRQ